jgi:ThiF family
MSEISYTTSPYFVRTEAMLGAAAMERLAGSCVAVAGLGGVGGAVLATLARSGIGRFRIADPGIFDPPDFNRQWAATLDTMDQNKAVVYEKFIRSVNPEAEVEVFTEGVTDDNQDGFLDGADLLIEALDVSVPPSLRKGLADRARAGEIHNILPPIVNFGTLVAIASPEGMPMDRFLAFLERARSDRKLPPGICQFFNSDQVQAMETSMAGGMIPSLAVATSLVSAVVTTESIMILGGDDLPGWRPPVCLPEVTVVDLSRSFCGVRNIEELESA